MLTPDGVISRYLYGVDYLARDVKLALVEASGGRVGTSFDKVLLSCYRYDPVNRKYAPSCSPSCASARCWCSWRWPAC